MKHTMPEDDLRNVVEQYKRFRVRPGCEDDTVDGMCWAGDMFCTVGHVLEFTKTTLDFALSNGIVLCSNEWWYTKSKDGVIRYYHGSWLEEP